MYMYRSVSIAFDSIIILIIDICEKFSLCVGPGIMMYVNCIPMIMVFS